MNGQLLLAFAGFPRFPIGGVWVILIGILGSFIIFGQCAGPDVGFFRQLLESSHLGLQGQDLSLLFLKGLLLLLDKGHEQTNGWRLFLLRDVHKYAFVDVRRHVQPECLVGAASA